jgi:hypothetical protein
MKKDKCIRYAVENNKGFLPEEYNWNYCIENQIPYILVHPKIKYASIEYDLLSVNAGLRFPDEHRFHEKWLAFYDQYASDSNLPDTQYSFIGGTLSGIFIIWKKDIPEVIKELISLLDKFVIDFGMIDPVLKEYNEIIVRMNKMMDQHDPSMAYDRAELERLRERFKALSLKLKN